MDEPQTTAAVQLYLDELAGIQGDTAAEPIISALLSRAVHRLHLLCGTLLHRSYSRLTRPPLNLQVEEMLSGVVERLIKALRKTRPQSVRGFFALANQHMRWELNDLARRLDEQANVVPIAEETLPGAASSSSGITANTRRMLQAIESLADDEREVFSLLRIQGMTQAEVAALVGVSTKTVQRRLNRGLILLTKALSDLRPSQ